MVDSPEKADLVFQLRSAAPIGGIDVFHGTGSSYRSPTLVLAVIDPKTQVTLWTLSQPVYTPLYKKDKTDWFSLSVLNLTGRLKLLSGTALTPEEVADLTITPRNHHSKAVWLWLLVPAAVAGGVTAVIVHEDNKYNQFATQNGLTCATNPFFCNTP